MTERSAVEYRITVLLGIIQQLQTTRQTEILKSYDLTRSQFSVLIHFSLHPERTCTVSDLTHVMEMNQPGITKIVKKLLDRQLLSTEEGNEDKRTKHLTITKAGLRFVEQCKSDIKPDNSYCFAEWSNEELEQFLLSLDKLKCWLDDHRNDIRND